MRRILIDTDTASDDAVALILALREPEVKVEAITVVAGNLPVDLALKNALVSVQVAGTYHPPVYRGMAKPLLRELYTSEDVHGSDGMGEMDLSEPLLKAEPVHAIDALIQIIEDNPHALELVTLGPLTNIAMVCLKAPDTIKKLKRITIMGGAGLSSGNITPVAEYNVFADAEAMSIVLQAGVSVFLVGWDVSMDTAFIDEADIETLQKSGSKVAQFCVRCNRSLQEFNLKRMNRRGFDLPDPVTVAAAIYPEIVLEAFDAYTYVEIKSEVTYGQVIIDWMDILKKTPNARICKAIDGRKFKERLFHALTEKVEKRVV